MPKSRGRAAAKKRAKASPRPHASPASRPATPDTTALLVAAAGARGPAGAGRTGAASHPAPAGAPEPRSRARIAAPRAAIQVASFTCDPIKDAEPQGLAVTYWFDAPPSGPSSPVRLRLTGRRIGTREHESGPSAADRAASTGFDIVRTIEGIVPGTGRTAVTTRIPHLAAGEWEVRAIPEDPQVVDAAGAPGPATPGVPLTATAPTAYGPIIDALAPGARLGAWPALVTSGAIAALAVQWFLSSRSGLPSGAVLLISSIACLIGLAGAKAYFLGTHRSEHPPVLAGGMCIQGFVIAAIAVVAAGVAIAGIPLGAVLDATAPGLLFGMAIGRLGCFFGGCCAGRPSASRWAVWSSDRALGVRRIPVQLMESSMSAGIGVAALIAAAEIRPPVGGMVFLAALAANTLGRQLLFPLRATPRATAHGRTATLLGSALALAVAIAVAAA